MFMNMIIRIMTNLFLKFSLMLVAVHRAGMEAGSHLEAKLAWIDDFSWPEEITGQGYDYGNPGLWLSYQPGDLRKFATIVGPGDTLISPGIITKWGGIKGYPVVYTSFAAGNVHYIR